MTPIVKAVQTARTSVVNIRGEKTIPASAGQASASDSSRRVNGMGTGVIFDARGYILTNFHVVDGVRDIQVTLADGERYPAKLASRDLETDLAIIKIEPKKPLQTMPLGTSGDLMTGETVIAVGNAYGYEHTVTRGIVSALHRAVQVSDAQFYDDLIQTDASINPGNSGGPLLNIDGEMIGLNVAVRSGAQGIGFAIPVDKAMSVAATMLASQNARKSWFGVVSAPTHETADKPGLVVRTVEQRSPAESAGLQPGDVIADLEGVSIHRPLDFQCAMLDRKPGDTLKVVVKRSDEEVKLTVTLGESAATTKVADQPAWDLLGLKLRQLSAEEFKETNQTKYRGGLMVTAVRPNSPASQQGIASGDILVGMHIWETATMENVSYILKRPDFATLNPVKFFILRGEETLYGYMPLTQKTAQRTGETTDR